MSEPNEPPADASADDVVMTRCFEEMMRHAIGLYRPGSNEDGEAVQRCCEVLEFWAELLCGESVWMRAVDLDRGCVGSWDFAIVVQSFPGGEGQVQQSLGRLQMIVAWYERFIGSNPGSCRDTPPLEGCLELAVTVKPS